MSEAIARYLAEELRADGLLEKKDGQYVYSESEGSWRIEIKAVKVPAKRRLKEMFSRGYN